MQSKATSAPSKIEQVIVSVPMSYEKAYLAEWEVQREPNRGMRGKLGKLFEDHIVDLGDLVYIATHAFNADTKAAALTLLAHQLGRPQMLEKASRFGPEVIGRSKYLEDQQWDSEMNVVVYGTGLIMIALFVLVEFIFRAGQLLLGGSSWPVVLISGVLALVTLLVPFGLYFGYSIKRELAKARGYRLGREGEEWVTDKIRALLDNHWSVFRNVTLPQHKEDNDLILVGPSGVYVLEVKAFQFPVRVRGKVWERLEKNSWRNLGRDPVSQVRVNAKNLRYFLDRQGVNLRVNAVVVLTQPQQSSNFDPTDEPVWKQFEVDEKLAGLNVLPSALSETDKTRILNALLPIVEK